MTKKTTAVKTTKTKAAGEESVIKETIKFRIILGTYERILYGIDVVEDLSQDSFKLNLLPLFMVPAHTGSIKCVAASVDGTLLASGATDEVIKLYDLKKKQDIGTLMQHEGTIGALVFYGKSHLLSAGDDGKMTIWKTKYWENLKTIQGHKGRINDLAVHPSGKLAISVGSDRQLRSWDLTRGIRTTGTKLHQEALHVLWNKKGDFYGILYNNKIEVYSVENAQVVHTFSSSSTSNQAKLITMCFADFGAGEGEEEVLVSGDSLGEIIFWSLENGVVLKKFQAHNTRVKNVAYIKCKKEKNLLISVSSDGLIRCWDLEHLNTVEEMQPIGEWNATSRVTCMTVAPSPPSLPTPSTLEAAPPTLEAAPSTTPLPKKASRKKGP